MPNQKPPVNETPLGHPLFLSSPRVLPQPPGPLSSPRTFSPCGQDVGSTRALLVHRQERAGLEVTGPGPGLRASGPHVKWLPNVTGSKDAWWQALPLQVTVGRSCLLVESRSSRPKRPPDICGKRSVSGWAAFPS